MAEKRTIETEESPNKRARLEETGQDEPAATESTQDDQERAVGITNYVSPRTPGFSCVLKQRYTDFLVNEILPDGRVLHLSNLPGTVPDDKNEPSTTNSSNGAESKKADKANLETRPNAEPESVKPESIKPDSVKPESVKPDSVKPANGASDVPEISEDDQTTLNGIFGEEVVPRILNLYAAIMTHPTRKPRDHPTLKSGVISDKSKRTEAHVAIRRVFQSKLETATLQDEAGVISIKAAPTKSVQGARGQTNMDGNGARQKGKLGWDELGGEWLHFTLYKENKDTMEVLYFIASMIKVHVKNFQFAGTKDRRGVTTQRVAVLRIRAERISGLQRSARGWVAGGFEYKKHGLDLGELAGNEFVLTLRDVRVNDADATSGGERTSSAKDVVSQAAEEFRTKGYINYYGLQRFGTFSTGTHIIGMKMLQGDLEGATDSILSYPPALLEDDPATTRVPEDDINRARAIHTWRQTGRGGEAISKMPKRFQAETSIIQYLSKVDKRTGHAVQARDWQGALMTIQRNLRLMYVHAYQSLVWNAVAGKRWEMLGDKIVEGDLVIVGEKGGDKGYGKRDELDDDGEPVFHPAAHDQSASAGDAFTRARPLSQEEAESGTFDIFDIVLPLPGFDVEYPPNDIGKFYEEFMGSEQGGRLDPHNMRRSWKDVSLSGGYRKVMARPGKAFSFEVREYEDENEQLVETDLEKLKREAGGSVNGAEEVTTKEVDGGVANDRIDDSGLEKQKKLAVVIKLQLGSSQYATMALRELTKGGAKSYKPEFSTSR